MDRAVTEIGPTAAAVRVAQAEPRWDAVVRVGEATDLPARAVAHAGPPFGSAADIPTPMRHSVEAACLFEGWATSWDEAGGLIDAGSLTLVPAQSHGIMLPLCGVASPSMAAVRVTDPTTGRRRYSVLNEGQDHATRYGVRDERLPEHMRWLNGEFATELATALERPVPLLATLGESLEQGDNGHGQTTTGSRLLVGLLMAARLSVRARAFLQASPAFALNLWMAAVACALSCAEDSGAALITRAGGNGYAFGVQTAAAPGTWIVCPAPVPGTADSDAVGEALPAVGDSALLDLFGLGAQAHGTAAPLLAESAQLGGRRICLSADVLASSGYEPAVQLGMIDRLGVRGRIAGGTISVPHALMCAAIGAHGG